MKLLLLDRDTAYTQRLKYYVSKKYVHLQISVCDTLEEATRLLQDSPFDVILFDSAFDELNMEEWEPLFGRGAFSYISDTNEIVNEQETILKYDKISEFYKKICGLYEKKRNRVVKTERQDTQTSKKTELITFFPVHGGAGSSTMAAACAISLAAEYRVLYVNLEQRPSDAVFFEGKGKRGISDIVSVLKTKYTDSGIRQVLDDVISQDTKQPSAKVSLIKGYGNIMDCLSMDAHSMETLLKLLREKLDYRFIILDADFIVSSVLNRLITESDKLVFVSSGSDISNTKLSKIQRYLEILKRDADCEMPLSYLLLNQYYGMNEELRIARDMEIIARIARYRTDDHSRITSQDVIEEVLSKKEIFAPLVSQAAASEEENGRSEVS